MGWVGRLCVLEQLRGVHGAYMGLLGFECFLFLPGGGGGGRIGQP